MNLDGEAMTVGSDLDTRMKAYESAEAERKLMPRLPTFARLDGRGFHNFTSDLKKPYDEGLGNLLVESAVWLMRNSVPTLGYVQSDEITLCWYEPDKESPCWCKGRVQKMNSLLAASLTHYFNLLLPLHLPKEYANKFGMFDCRVWQVPTLDEAANVFQWREFDALRNSVSMAARAYYEPPELHLKKRHEMKQMLLDKGVIWDNYPEHFKRGTYIKHQKKEHKFTAEEIEKLPPKHKARTMEDLIVMRGEYVPLKIPLLQNIVNKPAVLFNGATPVMEGDE